jgi:hypothetical protein
MPEQDCQPVNKYLPTRAKVVVANNQKKLTPKVANISSALLRWVDKTLSA